MSEAEIEQNTLLTHTSKTKNRIIEAKQIRELRELAKSKAHIAPTPGVEVCEFKGEILGMTTLEDYTLRHHRTLTEHNEPTPQRTDLMCPSAVESVFAETWYKEAGIVHARIAFPFESIQSAYDESRWFAVAGKIETVAGAQLKDLIHGFIDGVLFKVFGYFDSAEFSSVKRAFLTKYGEPTESSMMAHQKSYGAVFNGERIVWNFGDCTVLLNQFSYDLDTADFHILHDALTNEFASRDPGPQVDDF
ncbi:MAG: hypothetical protein RH917_07445 [Lacipirellulaceae bacterium]